jgi:hypothetical protein
MKMETGLHADRAATVKALHVQPGARSTPRTCWSNWASMPGMTLGGDPSTVAMTEVAAEFALETWAQVAIVTFAHAVALEGRRTSPSASTSTTQSRRARSATALTTYFAPSRRRSGRLIGHHARCRPKLGRPSGDGAQLLQRRLHEVGHSLGLDHPNDPTQVMYELYLDDTTLRLASGDLAGIDFIYGGGDGRVPLLGTLRRPTRSTGAAASRARSSSGCRATTSITGGSGNDRISGGSGATRSGAAAGTTRSPNLTGGRHRVAAATATTGIFAGIGNSRLDGGNGDDILVGGTGGDILLGGAGNDIILGDPAGAMMFGSDVIDGGPGDDLLAGGGGADVFVFRATGDADMIARFEIDWLDPAATLPVGRDFVPGLDRIAFEPGTFATAAEVEAAIETEAGSAVIRFGSASMTVFGVTEAELSADSFIFGEVIA